MTNKFLNWKYWKLRPDEVPAWKAGIEKLQSRLKILRYFYSIKFQSEKVSYYSIPESKILSGKWNIIFSKIY